MQPQLKPNPGGQLDPSQILGRDALIAEYWEILEGRGIYMNDLRRIGKTQIMVKMHAEGRTGWNSVKRDLGGCHTAAEFANFAFRDSTELLGKKKRSLRQMTSLLKQLEGAQVGPLKLPSGAPVPWKEVLLRTFSDLEEEMTVLGQRMVFFWDEVPFLLDNIRQREGAPVAMEVLDVLRSLAQDHDRIRLFLTGSIGIHHILSGLQAEGYINAPLNRMAHAQPGPLQAEDAILLARGLFAGAGLMAANVEACASAVAGSVGHVPYYVHLLISRLPKRTALTPDLIHQALTRELTRDDNEWDLEHYRNRLGKYYGAREEAALHVLDCVALDAPCDFQHLRKVVAVKTSCSEEDLRSLLKLLSQDHYLERTEENQYRFHLELIRTWWRLSRSL